MDRKRKAQTFPVVEVGVDRKPSMQAFPLEAQTFSVVETNMKLKICQKDR